MEKGTPMPISGSMMSAYITAASTPNSSTGMSVTCAQSSGVRVMVRMSYVSRSARYPARHRPAWRMNQTGVRSERSRRAVASIRSAPVIDPARVIAMTSRVAKQRPRADAAQRAGCRVRSVSMMNSTMQDAPLTITELFRHGAEVFPDSEVITFEGERARHASYATVAERIRRLAGALRALGVGPGDRVGTLCWNHQEHLEAYFAIPCMGAVLHTLNLRLPPAQLVQIVNHAEDRVIIVDASLAPLLAAIRPHLTTVQHVIVVGDGDVSALGETHSYDQVLQAASDSFDWPDIDERSAASMCYTPGATGDPKGVVYSHRSIYLHSLAVWASFRLDDKERVLSIVPMFHVNAWGVPFATWMVGSDLLLPSRFLQPEGVCKFIETERPTFTGGVPTIFTGMLAYVQAKGSDVSSLKRAIGGGSAVPAALITAFREKLGIELIQAWGMTETSPIGTIALPPKGTPPEQEMVYRSKTGRAVPGVELRIVDDSGAEVPHDGVAGR